MSKLTGLDWKQPKIDIQIDDAANLTNYVEPIMIRVEGYKDYLGRGDEK
jgi:hypothetical protein